MSLPKTDYPLIKSWASFCQCKNASFDVFNRGMVILCDDEEYFLNAGFPALLNASEKMEALSANSENN